ncbi:uncharacterized protein [Triticum aestivum]|uniref:uncharacterized protein n=1 Tax=Triticum aestivum TaxID=4565 RepID=UPI001D014F1A|nr:uncharacterized protein LOC123064753 [Triticum aestivum]
MLARSGGRTGDGTAWVVAVDMRRAVTEALVLVSTETGYAVTMYFPCAFPKYLDGDIIMALGASMEAETAADNTADTDSIGSNNQNFSDEDYWCAESLEGYALPFYGEGGQVFSDEEGSDQGNGIGTWCAQSYYGEARYGYCEEDEEERRGDMGNPMDNADVFRELPQYVSDPNPDPRANRRKERKKMRRRKKQENRRRSKKQEQEQEQEQKHHPLQQLVQFLDDRPELHPICFVACVLIAIIVREFLGTNPWQAG